MGPTDEVQWQQRWAESGLARARRIPGQRKFYALWTYPGTSGFLHVGHLRGVTFADVLHRYHRMLGEQVFLPMGTHASGLPAVTFAQKVANRDPPTLRRLKENGVSDAQLPALADPESAARFLGETYLAVFRRLGVLFDESSYVTTIDPDYRAFIRWQFNRLRATGALGQAPYFASYCPVCGPVSVDASETDLTSGGDAEVIRYSTVPFPLDDGRILLAATLRAETIYGVTNVWIHPTQSLVVWHHGTSAFVVGRTGGERLVEQHGGHLGHEVRPEELLGRSVRVPFTGATVPVLSSVLVDPLRGTGVVMSVPAHAPADWVGLAALSVEDRARVPALPEIIFIPPEESLAPSERKLLDGSGVPAERAVRALEVAGLDDRAHLDEATERLYRVELVHGRMLVPALGPIPVSEARERMDTTLEAAGTGFALREFSKPVVCRNGHAVVIRRVPDQWFLKYGETSWKERTHAALRELTVVPEQYGRELPSIIDWYEDRPCTRKGRWLGTPFPLDPSWIIEPIADSTFYPAYFPVRRFVRDGRLPVEHLTDALFDYVFLGEGPGETAVDRALQEEIRSEFTYWYPLDVNIGGKDHKRVHFPVFLFTHARLLPSELAPRGILMHGWVVSPEGGKISKKDTGVKGGHIPSTREAFDRWGADGLRLWYVVSASGEQDFEWDPDAVDQAMTRTEELGRFIRECLAEGGGGPPELEAWLEDALHRLAGEYHDCFQRMDLRGAAQLVFYALPATLRRYLARGGQPGTVVQRAAEAWIRLAAPITPHLSEELGHERFGSLVASQPMPEARQFRPDEVSRAREAFLEGVEDDLQSVLKPALSRGEPPRGVAFYVAAPWKRMVDEWMRTSQRSGGDLVKEVMTRAGERPELSSARGEIAAYVGRVGPAIRGEPAPGQVTVDEVAALRAAEGYLVRRFQFPEIAVHREEDAEPYDPLNRRQRARPGRPAFYLIGRVASR
ncbi:MAG TPA: class I tRNA ligase family protein [Thermoplasmata archaeon]|nr:class I tRNA ligase family protein [Thermoplasmata archaeon]